LVDRVPELRFEHAAQEPSAVVPHAGICAGGRQQRRSLPRSTEARQWPIQQRDLSGSYRCKPAVMGVRRRAVRRP
jgi:hypothetical protein